jgi:hypothetical protein
LVHALLVDSTSAIAHGRTLVSLALEARMNRLVIGTALVALFAGVLGGFVWWGVPARHAERELTAAQDAAARVGQEVADLRKELAVERSRRQALEGDLRTVEDTNQRLHLLVSEGRK